MISLALFFVRCCTLSYIQVDSPISASAIIHLALWELHERSRDYRSLRMGTGSYANISVAVYDATSFDMPTWNPEPAAREDRLGIIRITVSCVMHDAAELHLGKSHDAA